MVMTGSSARRLLVGVALAALVATTAPMGQAQGPESDLMASVRPLFSQESMNVYRRFAPEDRERMLEYYGKVLELRALSPINFQGGGQMILFGVGTGQVKLANGLKRGREYAVGPVTAGTGIRMITLFFPDEAALTARFAAFGYPAPQFRSRADGARVAMVADPGGFMTELVVKPGDASALDRIEVTIAVADLERSRVFYRDFVGLDELAPIEDAMLGVTRYPYRHGETTVHLVDVGRGLPADTGSAGIQYVVRDVDTVDARAKARSVAVEEPLSDLAGFSLRTVWLNDPDGATNYFAQVGGARGGGGRPTASR
jgi:catechol 2,3-dioxygenase-like lactoylglutathione lyase family enzyme